MDTVQLYICFLSEICGFLAYAVHHHSEISYYDGTKKMLMTDKENLKLNKVGAANDTDQAPMKVIGQGHCLVLLKRWPHSPVPKFIVVCPVAYGIYIHSPPKNTPAVVGSSVTFTCGVLDQRSGDSVFWKKVSEGEYAEVVSYNDWSLNSSKHDIFVRYTQSVEIEYLLEIHDVTMNDEAMYECQAGGDRARANLTVSVPPYNMTLEWDPTPPFILNSMVNLTCGAFHSRPPAEIIWLHGVKDLSDLADTYETFYNNSDGYGEVISVLTVDVDLNKAGSRYRCIARVPGQKREEAPSMSSYFLITELSSDGATLQSDTYHLCLLWLAVIKVFSSRMLI